MDTLQMKKSATRGWLALICVFLAQIVFCGFIGNQAGLLIEPISTDLGLPRTVYTSIESVTAITNAIISLFFIKFIDKIGLKRMAVLGSLGAILYCGLTLAASHLRSAAVPLFIVAQICQAFTMSWATVMTANIVVNTWFAKNRGLLISLIATSSAVGGMIAAPLVSNWILTTGWETSMVFRGVASIVVFVLFIILFRANPGQGDAMVWEGQSDSTGEAGPQLESGLTMTYAKKTKNFWACLFVCLGLGVFIYPPFIVLAAFCADCGLAEMAGTAMSVVFAAQIIVTLPMGVLIEKFGVRKVIAPIFALEAVALILFATIPSKAIIFVGAVAFGAGFACCNAFIPMLVTTVFGNREFAKIQSFFYSTMIVGMVIGPPIFNAVFDLAGAYKFVFTADAIALAVAIVVLFVATKKINFENQQ